MMPVRARALHLDHAPAAALALLQRIHDRHGCGDGLVTPRMLELARQGALGAEPGWDALDALGSAPSTRAIPAAGSPPPPAPVESPVAFPVLQESTFPSGPPPGEPPVPDDTSSDGAGAEPAPGVVDGMGRVVDARSHRPLAAGSAELGTALEAMAAALEEGAAWPPGARSAAGRGRLLDRLEEAVAAGLALDPGRGPMVLEGVRLRAAAAAMAVVMARREADAALRARAGSLAGHLLLGEPRRSVRAALVAALGTVTDLEEAPRETVAEFRAQLVPAAPPYAAWGSRGEGPLRVRHLVYAPEFRDMREAYVTAGFRVQSERPLALRLDIAADRHVVVELRRSPAVAVLGEDPTGEHVLVFSGLAAALPPPAATGPARVVVAALRRDPFGVPRIADRFPGDTLLGVARGDRMMDDGSFFPSLAEGLGRREPWAALRARCLRAAPLLAARALWPHTPGSLRAQGGAPAPFAADQDAETVHAVTAALVRPSRRPTDLRWRNDAPDATSHLALEVAAALACSPVGPEDTPPVLEPGGFHEGLPDVEIQTGSALWRLSLTRGLCGQSEEALAGLVTLHAAAQRALLLGTSPRLALLQGAARAARVLGLLCTTREMMVEVVKSVLRNAGIPPVDPEALAEAARNPTVMAQLERAHERWLAG